jgi:hypothetical protein
MMPNSREAGRSHADWPAFVKRDIRRRGGVRRREAIAADKNAAAEKATRHRPRREFKNRGSTDRSAGTVWQASAPNMSEVRRARAGRDFQRLVGYAVGENLVFFSLLFTSENTVVHQR